MPRYVYLAFILKAEPHLEIDKAVELFTLERGRLKTIAKGAMKVPNRFGAALTPLSLVEATVWESIRGGLTLELADLIWSSFSFMANPKAYPFLSLTCELFSNFVPENVKDIRSFKLLQTTAKLFSTDIKQNFLLTFYISVWLLKIHGFLHPPEKLKSLLGKEITSKVIQALKTSPAEFIKKTRLTATQFFKFQRYVEESLQISFSALLFLKKLFIKGFH